MLGATRTGALVDTVSIPPAKGELSGKGMRDWKAGVDLLKTCVHTHETATYMTMLSTFFIEFNSRLIPGACRQRLFTSEYQVIICKVCPQSRPTGTSRVQGQFIAGSPSSSSRLFFNRPGAFPPYDARYMLRYALNSYSYTIISYMYPIF
jgi:hypothetical protein